MPRIPIEILEEVKTYIENNPDKPPYSYDLEKKFNIKYKTLRNEFRHVYGIPIQEYHCCVKCCKMLELLLAENGSRRKTVYSFAVELGFSDDSGLHNFTKRRLKEYTFDEIRNNPELIKNKHCKSTCKCSRKC